MRIISLIVFVAAALSSDASALAGGGEDLRTAALFTADCHGSHSHTATNESVHLSVSINAALISAATQS